MALQEGRFDVIPYADLSPETTWACIGKGSFGRVFRGEYLGLDVAIKEILESNEYDVDKYFQREIRIMQESRHPNVVQYLGLCLAPPAPKNDSDDEDDSQTSSIPPYRVPGQPTPKQRQRILIISEFLTGGNLRSYICSHKLPFPWRLRLSFAVDVARAVAYMHARRCMHRDLKGENLLLTDNQRIKVCDFGFARIAARNEEEMRRMSYCGTDGYMSPEILLGNEFSLPTDVFSIGIIFCEILSRTLADTDNFRRDAPYFGLDSSEVHERASLGCPPNLITLALRCCDVDPQKRPTIRVVLEELRVIEREVLLNDDKTATDAADKTYHIGSMNFGGKMKTKKQISRPLGPGRIPSFEGRVSVLRMASSDSETSGDEAIEDVLAALEHVDVNGGLAEPAEKEYSTSVVGRNSKISQAGSTTFSVATIRPLVITHHKRMESDQSFPSIPASWLVNVNSEVRAAVLGTPVKERPKPTEDALKEAIEDAKDKEALAEEERDDEGRDTITSLISIAAATVNGGGDVFDDPVMVEEDDIFFSASSKFDHSLHRFTFIKPGWKFFASSRTNSTAIRDLKNIQGLNKSALSVDAPEESRRSLDNAHKPTKSNVDYTPFSKCEFCDRRLGMMKAYMSCDDCGYRCHTKCADIAPRNCGNHLEKAVSADPIAPGVPTRESKLKRRSRVQSTPIFALA